MRSNLKEMVSGIAEERGIILTSFQGGRIRDIERQFDSGTIAVKDVIYMLKKEFSYRFEEKDYAEIKKILERK